MRCINQFNYDSTVGREPGGGVSLTIPDQTMSLRELVTRFARGQEVPIFEPIYNDLEEDFPDVSRMDTLERLDLARNIKQAVAVERENIVAKRKQRATVPPPPPPPVDLPTDDLDGFK